MTFVEEARQWKESRVRDRMAYGTAREDHKFIRQMMRRAGRASSCPKYHHVCRIEDKKEK